MYPVRLLILALSLGHILTFTACIAAHGNGPQGPGPALEGTTWHLVILRGDPVRSPQAARPVFLRLDPEQNRLQGYGGCNTFFGAYTVQGDSIDISQLGSTRMACPTGMELEHKFLTTLGRSARWEIRGENLRLLDNTGTIQAIFQASPPR